MRSKGNPTNMHYQLWVLICKPLIQLDLGLINMEDVNLWTYTLNNCINILKNLENTFVKRTCCVNLTGVIRSDLSDPNMLINNF